MRTERLELEITSTIMSVPARAERVLQTLHDMGFSLTIDDYGSRPVPADQLTAWLSALEALPRPARSRTSATPRAGARVSG